RREGSTMSPSDSPSGPRSASGVTPQAPSRSIREKNIAAGTVGPGRAGAGMPSTERSTGRRLCADAVSRGNAVAAADGKVTARRTSVRDVRRSVASYRAMPELPEVEVVRRELVKLRGGTIVRLDSADRRIFVPRADVVGRAVREVGRRGKWLRLELDAGFVFSHLGMTGDWALRGAGDAPLPFERVRMDVEQSGRTLSARYTDARRF